MASQKRIIIAQADDPIAAQEAPDSLPADFANRAGWLAHINQATLVDLPQRYPGVDVMSVVDRPGGIRDEILIQKAVRPDDPPFSSAITTLSGKDAKSLVVDGLRVIITNLNDTDQYSQQEAQAAANQLEGYALAGASAAQEIKRIVDSNTQLKQAIDKMQAMNGQRGVQVPSIAATNERIIIAQSEMPTDSGSPALADAAPEQQGSADDPLSADKFDSVEQLRKTLIQLGPKAETYNKVFDLVGPEYEDSAKSALAKFFEGSPDGLCSIYSLLVQVGVASPIDQQTIGELMEKHPEVFPKEGDADQKPQPQQPPTSASSKITLKKASIEGAYIVENEDGQTLTARKDWDYPTIAKLFGWDGQEDNVSSAEQFLEANIGKEVTSNQNMFGEGYKIVKASLNGLFLPPEDSSLNTMQKTASGSVGGPSSYNYTLSGPDDRRMCPKIRNVVPTYICRYHCLDGLVIDDAQVLCGEAIWRQSVMDKFSREYKDADGNWVGGYINKRFEVDRTTHEHPYQLKPGQRMAPINEDAWSTEKRLQEMRRESGSERGYSETPGDPKDLYNFDQHALVKGPKSPDLSGKDKDPIAKLSSASPMIVQASSMFREAADPKFKGVEWAEPETQEEIPFEGKSHNKADEKKDEKKTDKPEEKKEHKAYNKAKIIAQNLMPIPGGSAAMGDYDKIGQRAVKCKKCGKVAKNGTQSCPACQGPMRPYYMSEIMNETKAIPAPSMKASSETIAIYANGIYKISKDGKSFFGATIQEAQTKMHQQAPMSSGSVQEESQQLENIIQDTGVKQIAPAVAPKTPVPAPVQQGADALNVIPAIGDDVNGGMEEEIDPVTGQPIPHVDASNLDHHMMQDRLGEEPVTRKNRTQEFASYGLGADPKSK